MPDSVIILGNVSFNKSDVKSYETKVVPAKYFGKDGSWTEVPVKKWFVTLKQGTKLIFPEQDTDYTMPSVRVNENNLYFAALERAKVIDTKKSENFIFEGCNLVNLDSNSGGGGTDTVTSSDLFLMGGPSKPQGKCSGNFNAGDKVNGYTSETDFNMFF